MQVLCSFLSTTLSKALLEEEKVAAKIAACNHFVVYNGHATDSCDGMRTKHQ